MRKFKLIYISFFVSISLFSQNSDFFNISIGPSTGYNFHSSFNEFRKTYNDFGVSNGTISKKMSVFSPNYGFLVIGRIKLNQFSFFIGYNYSQAFTSSDLNSGSSRKFRRITRIPFYTGVGIKTKKGAQIDLTASFGRVELLTGYKYSDGELSYGQDSKLNGSYTSFIGMIGIAYEKNLYGKLKKFKIRTEILLPLIPKGSSNKFTDWSWPRKTLYGYFTELPTDYGLYKQSPLDYPVESTNYVNNRIRIFQLSLLYTLNSKN